MSKTWFFGGFEPKKSFKNQVIFTNFSSLNVKKLWEFFNFTLFPTITLFLFMKKKSSSSLGSFDSARRDEEYRSVFVYTNKLVWRFGVENFWVLRNFCGATHPPFSYDFFNRRDDDNHPNGCAKAEVQHGSAAAEIGTGGGADSEVLYFVNFFFKLAWKFLNFGGLKLV